MNFSNSFAEKDKEDHELIQPEQKIDNRNNLNHNNKSKDFFEKKVSDCSSIEYNNIMKYYYTTCIYLSNHLNISAINKSSKNFVSKNRINAINKNKFGNYNIYMENIVKNATNFKYCENKDSNDFPYVNNCDSNPGNKIFFNNCINTKNQFVNKAQNYINYNYNEPKIVNQNNNYLFQLYQNIPQNIIYTNINFSINIPPINQEIKSTELNIPNLGYKLPLSATEKSKEEIPLEHSKDGYLTVMFGKRGWICNLCNNFNYEQRIKCNRCGVVKNPKIISNINQRNDKELNKRENWICGYCSNLNYSFRTICNRCKASLSTKKQNF